MRTVKERKNMREREVVRKGTKENDIWKEKGWVKN